MTRYAEGTSVPMERSRAEAEKTLMRYGAKGFAYAWEQRLELYPHSADCELCHGTRVYEPRAIHGPQAPAGTRPCTRFPYGAPKQIEREVVVIQFLMKERNVRLEVPMPHEVEAGSKARAEAAVRQRWRALVLVLKAKLEAVASGISTLESEFLANIVMQNGQTIGAAMLHRLPDVVSSGRLLPAHTEATP